MQVKHVPTPPAVALIGRVTRAAMLSVLQALDDHGATDWKVTKVGSNADGDYFVVSYTARRDGRRWSMVFGTDGSLWMD